PSALKEFNIKEKIMDGREARLVFGFLLLGIAPILATTAGASVGMIVFAAGLLVGTTAVA
ncbi:MAG: hypothetical protein LLG42_00710, partial [Chloroflexi bacterium]|nr:hypothetical protein [Chloroflexota bacterium]